jgi:N2-acetyl-L-2,4-diaminobutanoate deacetylase
MDRPIVRPYLLDFETPGRRDYWVALEHDSIWGDHLIPMTVFVGPKAEPGRGLLVTGSNHGNEYEGPAIIRHTMRDIAIEDMIGRIILIPILNVAAFKAGTRDSTLDDRVNLNRAFVDGAGKTPLGGITHRIAAFVRQFLWGQAHAVIDLHAGGQVARFAPCTSFHPLDDPEQHAQVEQAARWFGTPLVVVYQNETPGLLPSEAERLGKVTVGTELGWGGAISEVGVRHGRHGVRACAIHQGQLKGRIEKIGAHAEGTQKMVAMVDRECFTPAPFAGHFEPLIPCGGAVSKGDVVGLLHDFDRIDLDPWPVRAGVDGIVIAEAWGAPVMQGQHILVTGKIVG